MTETQEGSKERKKGFGQERGMERIIEKECWKIIDWNGEERKDAKYSLLRVG